MADRDTPGLADTETAIRADERQRLSALIDGRLTEMPSLFIARALAAAGLLAGDTRRDAIIKAAVAWRDSMRLPGASTNNALKALGKVREAVDAYRAVAAPLAAACPTCGVNRKDNTRTVGALEAAIGGPRSFCADKWHLIAAVDALGDQPNIDRPPGAV